MNDSTGERHRSDRGELDLVAFQIDTTENSVRFSSVGHPTPSSGLPSTLLWTESRFAGEGSSGWLAGMATSSCGEYIQLGCVLLMIIFSRPVIEPGKFKFNTTLFD